MSRAAVVLLAAGAAAWAQTARPSAPVRPVAAQVVTPANVKTSTAAAPATPGAATVTHESKPQRVPLAVLDNLKRAFDGRLQAYFLNDPIDILGLTQGVYVSGYGAIFTTELSPIITPGISPFRLKITDEEKKQVHERKLARIPAIGKLMRDMLRNSADLLVLMPADQMVVVSVRFSYLPWEDRTGLPDGLIMKADRRTAQADGEIQTEEQ
jgi:hypothetical protein